MAETVDEIITAMPLTTCPNELFLQILQYLNAKQIHQCLRLNRGIAGIIKHHRHHLARTKCSIHIRYIPMVRSFFQEIKPLQLPDSKTIKAFVHSEKDFEHQWFDCEISELSIESITGNLDSAMETLVEQLCKTRQRRITMLNLRYLNITGYRNLNALLRLFHLVAKSLKKLSIENCQLPITGEQIAQNLPFLNHFTCYSARLASQFLVQLGSQFDIRNVRSYRVEIFNCPTAAVVCNLINNWQFSTSVPILSIEIHGFTSIFQTEFDDECKHRRLQHNFYEFPAKFSVTAHLKVQFIEESQICRIWSVIDVPARPTGQLYCFARFFRDF